ncbi:hypothetical protein [Mycobacterium sp.]|uniref:hypothetical protein n=1 Tax=Mycobacterium sp. TaxID=1785 RepID=UPI003F97E213
MTTYLISLSTGRTVQAEGDDVATRADGSLWVLRAPPKPLPMTPVAIFAARTWTSCFTGDASVTFTGASPQPATNADADTEIRVMSDDVGLWPAQPSSAFATRCAAIPSR